MKQLKLFNAMHVIKKFDYSYNSKPIVGFIIDDRFYFSLPDVLKSLDSGSNTTNVKNRAGLVDGEDFILLTNDMIDQSSFSELGDLENVLGAGIADKAYYQSGNMENGAYYQSGNMENGAYYQSGNMENGVPLQSGGVENETDFRVAPLGLTILSIQGLTKVSFHLHSDTAKKLQSQVTKIAEDFYMGRLEYRDAPRNAFRPQNSRLEESSTNGKAFESFFKPRHDDRLELAIKCVGVDIPQGLEYHYVIRVCHIVQLERIMVPVGTVNNSITSVHLRNGERLCILKPIEELYNILTPYIPFMIIRDEMGRVKKAVQRGAISYVASEVIVRPEEKTTIGAVHIGKIDMGIEMPAVVKMTKMQVLREEQGAEVRLNEWGNEVI